MNNQEKLEDLRDRINKEFEDIDKIIEVEAALDGKSKQTFTTYLKDIDGSFKILE